MHILFVLLGVLTIPLTLGLTALVGFDWFVSRPS